MCVLESLQRNETSHSPIENVVLEIGFSVDDFYEVMLESYGPPSDPAKFLLDALRYMHEKEREEMDESYEIDLVNCLQFKEIMRSLEEELIRRWKNPYPYDFLDHDQIR